MRVLLVGAGAVGQVYGLHLQRGGAKVGFLVKPAYAEEARRGFVLHPLKGRGPVRFEGFEVFTDAGEAARAGWDAVMLCVAGDALHKGTWLADLTQGLPDAAIVVMQGGLESPLPGAHIVQGIIGMVSYAAPLEGEKLDPPGVAYWLPRMVPSLFSGEGAGPIVDVLKKGGMPAAVAKDVAATRSAGEAVLAPVIAMLEAGGWSFARVKSDRALRRLAHRAIVQRTAIAAAHHGRKPPFAPRLLGPGMIRLFATVAPKLVPFPAETYLRVHFTKVQAQQRDGLKSAIARGTELHLDVTALNELLARVEHK